MTKKEYQNTKSWRKKPSLWMSPRRAKSTGGSTGTRIATGRFSALSPKGGFVEPIYDAAKNVARDYWAYSSVGYI